MQKPFEITVLGTSSATPTRDRNPSAQYVRLDKHYFLIDCGEATQLQLTKYNLRLQKIKYVLISHLHGDHFYGLVGLISTFMLLNRQTDLHVYGPKGIKEIILLQLRYSNSFTGYNLYFHELTSKESEIIYEDEKVLVKTIPLKHRIVTNGFLFQEKNIERKLNFETIENYTIDKVYFNKIKFGGDVTLEDGTVIPNSELSFPPLPVKSYAYCSDTKYDEKIIPIIENVDYLYHESTFLEGEEALSEKTMHSIVL
jgi:ribonuclease Z